MPIRIYIDQGHNPYGFNAGAEGFGLREQDITYLVGAYLANILNADSRFTAITSRTSPDEILGYDTNSSLRTRTKHSHKCQCKSRHQRYGSIRLCRQHAFL